MGSSSSRVDGGVETSIMPTISQLTTGQRVRRQSGSLGFRRRMSHSGVHTVNRGTEKKTQQAAAAPDASTKKPKKASAVHQGVDPQLKYSLSVLVTMLVLHQFAPLRPYTSKFLAIHHVDPDTHTARAGPDDVCFVAMWVVNLVLLRAITMQYVYEPLGKLLSLKRPKTIVRFAEQGWSFTYFVASTAVGVWLLLDSPYKTNPRYLWQGWPHYQMKPAFKAYYLVQLATWLSQLYTINIEEKRKDHAQMFTHHIVTILLVAGSYYFHYTRVGHVILMLMDNVDFLLSAAKMLKYLDYSRACDAMFTVFMLSWVACRHGLYLYFTYSAATDGLELMQPGCYHDDDGELVICISRVVPRLFIGMLLFLHCITMLWFYLIAKVAIKVIRGDGAEEPRSDDEDDGDDDNDAGADDD